MQFISNIAQYLVRSPPSAEQRPDDSDTLASHAVEEAGGPDVRPGKRSRATLANVVDRKPLFLTSRELLDTTPVDRSNMRQRKGTASDESRLFPSYTKSQGDVPIKPGQTFNQAPKSKIKKHAILRPVDRITQKGKDSGPVRAWGKSSVNGHAQRPPSPPHLLTSPPSRSPFPFDNESRATKRRHSSGQVIDLDADDDILMSPTQHQTGSWHRNRTPSVASVESLQQKEPKRNATQVFQVPEDGDSEVDEKSTSKRGLTGLRNATARCGQNDTVEHEDTRLSAEDIGRQKPIPPRKIQADELLDSDDSESPDELQKDISDRKYAGLHRRPIKSELSLDDSRESIVKRINRRQSPNDIRPTVFNSSNKTPDRKLPKIRQPAKSHRHLFEVRFFRYGDIEMAERNMQLCLDEGKDTIGLIATNQHVQQAIQNLPSETIPVHRVVQVLLGTDGNLKCRLKLSKIEGLVNQDSADIEFGNQRDKDQLCDFLRNKGITFQNKDGNWMDKAFDKVIKGELRRGKRPSNEVIPESANDVQVESVKRQKLSTALQGQDVPRGIKQPPRRVALPATQLEKLNPVRSIQNDEDTSIPVKKYQDPSTERENRSKAHRGPVDLVDNEPAATSTPRYKAPASDRTWSQPLVYPREGKKKAEVDSKDLERLRDGEFLNDNLIGFYLRFLEHHLERNNPDVAKRVYFFNSYFFATLTNTTNRRKGVNYESVQKWTRNVDLFSQDYVIVPINESAHWYLAIICNLNTLIQREKSVEPDVSDKNVSEKIHEPLIEKQEIPETPPPERTSTPEGSARDSLASMKIDDIMSRIKSQDVRGSDDEWPEKEENQTTPPTIFQNKASSGASVPDAGDRKKAKKQKRGGQVYSIDQPTIITFDSLGLARSSAVKILKAYLSEEASAKQSLELDIKDIKGMTAKEIPLQPNYSDCGLYLLAYLERFVQDPDIFIRKLLQKEMSAEDDWPTLKSGLLRRRLRNFLLELHEEQETSQDNGLVDARPISYLLGQQSDKRDGNAESANPAHVADPQSRVPDSIQEEVDANGDSAITYDSAGEVVVQETQLSTRQTPMLSTEPDYHHESKTDYYQRIDHPVKDQHGDDPVQSPKDIFHDMYDYISQDALPKDTVEVQVPTIQVAGTPPSAKESKKWGISPRKRKTKKLTG